MSACGFEKDLSLALREGRWPAAADPSLREHVAGCRNCSDLVLVTQTLQLSRATMSQVPVLPAPGIIFWRAQLRRRTTAAERMTRPILFTEMLAFAATLAAFLFVVRQAIRYVDWRSLGDSVASGDWHSNFSFTAMTQSLAAVSVPLWLPIGGLLLFALGGLAVYVLAHNE
jgi:hypothetical protein